MVLVQFFNFQIFSSYPENGLLPQDFKWELIEVNALQSKLPAIELKFFQFLFVHDIGSSIIDMSV